MNSSYFCQSYSSADTTNARLDKDKDGLLCEDDLEMELSFLATMDMFKNISAASTSE